MITPRAIDEAIIANRPGEPFVYHGDGSSLDGLDWQADTTPPTWAQVRAWATPIADASAAAEVNEATLRDRLEAALAVLEDRAANWAALTPAQKDTTALLCVRVNAALIRLRLRRLDTAP